MKLAALISVAGVSLLLILAAGLFFTGVLLVRDAEDSVDTVGLRGGTLTIEARRWPGGIYFARIRFDGEGFVTCRNGRHISLDYVTPGMSVIRTLRARDCRPGAPAVVNF